MFAAIAQEQAKLGERDRALETFKAAFGVLDRGKEDQLLSDTSRLELFKAQVEAKFLPEAIETLDLLANSSMEEEFSNDRLLNDLEELVRLGDDKRNEPLIEWVRQRGPIRRARKKGPSTEKSTSGYKTSRSPCGVGACWNY